MLMLFRAALYAIVLEKGLYFALHLFLLLELKIIFSFKAWQL